MKSRLAWACGVDLQMLLLSAACNVAAWLGPLETCIVASAFAPMLNQNAELGGREGLLPRLPEPGLPSAGMQCLMISSAWHSKASPSCVAACATEAATCVVVESN